ncbi:CBL-interacting protein kinase 24 [Porphyridium purpureum]|uniref:non-specific serine/threonine protein kinase n=1 Tax=Porphyridium purpureum TaxID=35688 RepID=A0A5J4YVQ2_PORPP|nr:CBL-interacting protein kinase 24 [Porphyridium purpureum]|eukprot:POR8481..scf227_4
MALRVGPYILREVLGSGSFADVRLGISEKTGEKFAVKVFEKSKVNCEDFETEVRREVKIMQYLRHPHIVSVHQVLMTGNNMYVVMELVTGGELYYEIVKHRRIPENTSRLYFQQLVDAMNYCHRKGVFHRDLKPENLLLDGKGGIKITDFGMSWMKEHSDQTSDLLHTQCGTPKYMAPEVITKARYGYRGDKIDVWDCGMILFALMAGYLPFNGEDDRAVFRQIVFGRVKFPQWFSDGACDLLMHMLEKDPEKRWTLEQVRKHPWFLVDYQGDPLEKLKRERAAEREQEARRYREHEGVAHGVFAGTGEGVSKSRGRSRSRSVARGDDVGGSRARSRSAMRGSNARMRSRSRPSGPGDRGMSRRDRSESRNRGGSRDARRGAPRPPHSTKPSEPSKLAETFLSAAETLEAEKQAAPCAAAGTPRLTSPRTAVYAAVTEEHAREGHTGASTVSPRKAAAGAGDSGVPPNGNAENVRSPKKKPAPVSTDPQPDSKISGRLGALLSPRSQAAKEAEKMSAPVPQDQVGLGRLMNILSPRSAQAAATVAAKSPGTLADDDEDVEASERARTPVVASPGDYFDGATDSSSQVVAKDGADLDELPKNFKGLKLSTTNKGVKKLVHKWRQNPM